MAPASKHPLVDQRPLQTAQRMATMAATPEEQALAHDAEKVGDHEVDLAFFDALRTAEQNPPPLSPEAKQLSDRKNKAELALKDDQENVALLTRKLAAAPESQKDNLQDQLEEAGGDPQSKIKRLKSEHDAGEHNTAPSAGAAVNPHEQDFQSHTLLNVFRAWQASREKKAQLLAAQEETSSKRQHLAQRHSE